MSIPENFRTVVRGKNKRSHQSRLKSYVLIRPPYRMYFSIALTRLLRKADRYPKSVEINLSPDQDQMVLRFSDMTPDDLRFSVPRNKAETTSVCVLGLAEIMPEDRRYMMDEKLSNYPELWFFRVSEKKRNMGGTK